MTFELNENEVDVLLKLLDLANKAGGLSAAEACIHFAKKLQIENKEPAPIEQ